MEAGENLVGWAKRSVPTGPNSVRNGGHGAKTRLCPPYRLGFLPINVIVTGAVVDEKVRDRSVALIEIDAPRERQLIDLAIVQLIGAGPLLVLIALRHESTIAPEAQIHEKGMFAVTKHRNRGTI